MCSMVNGLIVRGRIKTTLPKARQARRLAERMVTIGRKGDLAARRLAASRLKNPSAVRKLFDTVVPGLEGRAGGYTRIIKVGQRRGDGAEMCLLEWTGTPTPAPADFGNDAAGTGAEPAPN